ncbi:MAG TPA: zinc ribbon domain-containing protein [Actinomycetota bacterium]|nr:zinc ribbon domain-containing protein [Actinomycetota bacterium]
MVKTTLPPDMRMFSCEGCGLMIDRDLNAARNLARLAGLLPVRWNCPR